MLITAPSDMNKGEVEATPKIIKKWKTSANAPVPQRYSHSKSLQVTRLYSVNWKQHWRSTTVSLETYPFIH